MSVPGAAGVKQAASGAGRNLFNLLFFYMKNCVKRKFAQNWEPSTLVITYFNVLFDSSPDYCDFKAPGISSSHERLELWGREMGISPPCDCMENLGKSTQTCLSWKINRETLHTL